MKRGLLLATAALIMAPFVTWSAAAQDASGATGAKVPPTSLDFRSTADGGPLDFSMAQKEGSDTKGVAEFFKTGKNPYMVDKSCLKAGESMFLTSCSGCHGHLGEGKIGPGLNDSYWTYPKNTNDQGLFETIYGGASGQMGPHYGDLTLDQMLQVMAWVRFLYKDKVEDAAWLSDEQKKNFKPYKEGVKMTSNDGQCKADAEKVGK